MSNHPTRCNFCGGTFVALPASGLCYDCNQIDAWWTQVTPPALTDGDQHMIVNHYTGA